MVILNILGLVLKYQLIKVFFSGILQLLQTRTSRRFFVVRLTPEMEKKMVFLCTDVKFGTQKRYQEWFQKQVNKSVLKGSL